jgi:hypothetical protein
MKENLGNPKDFVHLTLDDFVSGVNEGVLIDTVTSKELLDRTRFRPVSSEKIVNPRTDFKIQAYIKTPHFENQFEKRFIKGEEQVSHRMGNTLFKDLPDWKPLTHEIFKEKLLLGINKLITDHKLTLGGYHIISQSTRMVIPVANVQVKDENKRALIISSIFHTAMTNLDVFKWHNRPFDRKQIIVEYRDWDAFKEYVQKTNVYMIEGINVELFIEDDEVYPNTPIIFVE